MRISYLVVLFALFSISLHAQPVNDDCNTAIHLSNSDTWCSAPAAYTNVNASPYAGPPPDDDCFLQLQNDVWFTFTPQTPALYIRVTGAVNGLGTLEIPESVFLTALVAISPG